MLPPQDQTLTPQAREPQQASSVRLDWGLGDQSEEQALASSSSGHLEQKGATAVSWPSGLISQMSNCSAGNGRGGPRGPQ